MQAMATPTFREALTSAIGFWERGRLAYNLVLLAVVAAVYTLGLPGSRQALQLDTGLQLFLLAAVANILYCAAYVVDVAVQFSAFRSAWLRKRWLLLAGGSLFAATLAQFIARALFGWPAHG
jgi:hypothetical protein